MGNLTDRARTGKDAESITPASTQMRALARNAPRSRHGAEGTDRRSRRADALNRLPESMSESIRAFVSTEFDRGKDYSAAIAAAVEEGRQSVRNEPREPTLSAEERLLCSRLGISESDYRRYNR